MIDFDILPNTCITVQLLYSKTITFTDKIQQLPNHKLFRVDNVFLYPNYVVTFGQNLYDPNILSYYRGRFLRPPTHICYGSKCHLQKLNISVYRTSGYHLRVFYPWQVIQPIYVVIEAAAYPTGHNTDKNAFTSFTMNYRKGIYSSDKESYSWLSSIIYHINCSN